MDIIQIIKKLQEERATLCLNRAVNETQINKCDQLITYYCKLYNRTLSSINEKKEYANFYEDIITFKEMISSPQILEKITLISDKHLQEKIKHLDEKIDKLMTQSNTLRKKTLEYKKKKYNLEDKNEKLNSEIEIVDYNIKRYRLQKVK